MLIKKARYEHCKACKRTEKQIRDDVYGCDSCKKKIETKLNNKSHYDFLKVDVFYNRQSMDTDHYQFCSWRCVLKFLPKIKTNYFVSLPFLQYEPDVVKGQRAEDLFKALRAEGDGGRK